MRTSFKNGTPLHSQIKLVGEQTHKPLLFYAQCRMKHSEFNVFETTLKHYSESFGGKWTSVAVAFKKWISPIQTINEIHF
jgi:hypothetical protein